MTTLTAALLAALYSPLELGLDQGALSLSLAASTPATLRSASELQFDERRPLTLEHDRGPLSVSETLAGILGTVAGVALGTHLEPTSTDSPGMTTALVGLGGGFVGAALGARGRESAASRYGRLVDRQLEQQRAAFRNAAATCARP